MPSTTPANIANPWIWCEHLHLKERSYWNKTRSKHRCPAQAGTTLLLFHRKQTSDPSPKEPTSKPCSNETVPSCNLSRFHADRLRRVDFPPPVGELALELNTNAQSMSLLANEETELMVMTITSPLQTRSPQSGTFGTGFLST